MQKINVHELIKFCALVLALMNREEREEFLKRVENLVYQKDRSYHALFWYARKLHLRDRYPAINEAVKAMSEQPPKTREAFLSYLKSLNFLSDALDEFKVQTIVPSLKDGIAGTADKVNQLTRQTQKRRSKFLNLVEYASDKA